MVISTIFMTFLTMALTTLTCLSHVPFYLFFGVFTLLTFYDDVITALEFFALNFDPSLLPSFYDIFCLFFIVYFLVTTLFT